MNKNIVGMGELLWDCVGTSRRPAGAPANVAYHAAQWGLNSRVFSRVGNDPLGKELVKYLDDNNVDTRYIQIDDSLPTSTVDVDVSNPQSPRYNIHENVAWDNMIFTDQWSESLSSIDAFCFGTLAQRSDTSRNTLDCVLCGLPETALIVFDVNLRKPYFYRKWIERALFSTWLLKISEEEAETFSDEMGLGISQPGKLYAQAIRNNFDIPAVCFTSGKNGCSLYTQDDSIILPGVPISPCSSADSVGAGDAFTAGLIYGFLNQLSPEITLSIANHAAAYTVSQYGSMPAVKDYYNSLKQTVESGAF